ncbi:hypothetical protein L195_g061984 [Trifolium pratense]|uniref:Uncharacterized protein n=1 Tax=Trifolium pratense TaxID=57577 RepID=A0A2K3KD03_TRIPR|nr:hypothetical protein L195_g061984 [Trifolium pratense]
MDQKKGQKKATPAWLINDTSTQAAKQHNKECGGRHTLHAARYTPPIKHGVRHEEQMGQHQSKPKACRPPYMISSRPIQF